VVIKAKAYMCVCGKMSVSFGAG